MGRSSGYRPFLLARITAVCCARSGVLQTTDDAGRCHPSASHPTGCQRLITVHFCTAALKGEDPAASPSSFTSCMSFRSIVPCFYLALLWFIISYKLLWICEIVAAASFWFGKDLIIQIINIFLKFIILAIILLAFTADKTLRWIFTLSMAIQDVNFECSDQILNTLLLIICIDTTLSFKNNSVKVWKTLFIHFYFVMFLSCEEKVEISLLTWS